MRDDFSRDTKSILALRVGLRCSNPHCRKLTSGPQTDSSKALNIGVAAHITAASTDGPRYDPNLSSEERKAPDNGIWLCQSCAKLVDNDEQKYTDSLLHEWKRLAEEAARVEVENRLLLAPSEEVRDVVEELTQFLNELKEDWKRIQHVEQVELSRGNQVISRWWLSSQFLDLDVELLQEVHNLLRDYHRLPRFPGCAPALRQYVDSHQMTSKVSECIQQLDIEIRRLRSAFA
jgi:hypothetical protein